MHYAGGQYFAFNSTLVGLQVNDFKAYGWSSGPASCKRWGLSSVEAELNAKDRSPAKCTATLSRALPPWRTTT